MMYLKVRPEYPQICSQVKVISKQLNLAEACEEMDTASEDLHPSPDVTKSGLPIHLQLSKGPRYFCQGPKTYPCKFYHGAKGCQWGDQCTFIHEAGY